MTARELLSPLYSSGADAVLLPDVSVTLVTENAAQAHKEAIFVCIRGTRADGHDFAPSAYEKGCRLFVAEKELPLPADAFVCIVSDARFTLATLACRFFGNPSQKLSLIGITGTKGKTTTAQFLFSILNDAGIPTGYIGTNGIRYASVFEETQNTTPDALTFQRTLFEMHRAGIRVAVVEVSSQALMQHRVAGTRFATCVFTNLSPDHIGQNEHLDFSHYAACKRRLFHEFGANTVICNADDEAAPFMLDGMTDARVLFCSAIDRAAHYRAGNIRLTRDTRYLGVSFSVCSEKEIAECIIPLPGAFNAQNALLAAATANAVFEVPLSKAASSLATATVDGRSEMIPLPSGACAVIDYAHNGLSLHSLLSTLRQYRHNRLICLFGSIGDRAKLRRRELGTVAEKLCDLCILTSDNPGSENAEAIIADIAEAFEGKNTPYLVIPDRAKAIQEALALCKEGDILVLAGKGHEHYQLVNGQKLPFSEREIVLEFCQTAPIRGR